MEEHVYLKSKLNDEIRKVKYLKRKLTKWLEDKSYFGIRVERQHKNR